MNYRFGLIWLRAFREGPEAVRELYAEDFVFQDMVLDALFDETTMDAQPRDRDAFVERTTFCSNTDPSNGIGIHNFQLKDYLGDETCGVILWTWTATFCASFLGIPTGGRTISTDGHTWQRYENGKIKRSSACLDVIPVLKQLGLPVERDFGLHSAWPDSLSAIAPA
jgi:steroid delta-isomerase-like uncharacterized protein